METKREKVLNIFKEIKRKYLKKKKNCTNFYDKQFDDPVAKISMKLGKCLKRNMQKTDKGEQEKGKENRLKAFK